MLKQPTYLPTYQPTNQPFVREAAPKRVFKREGRLEINPLLIKAFGITPEEIGDVIKSAEEPEAMRDMFAFLSDYATLSDQGTRLLISGDKLDFLVADMRRRMARVADFYEYHAKTSGDIEEEERLLKFARKAKQLSRPVGDTRTDKIAYIDAVMGFQHTSGFILPLAFRITDYGREDYWPKKLLAFLRSHGMPGMVRENATPEKIRYTLLKTISSEGYPVSDRYYKRAHEIANYYELMKHGSSRFLEIEELGNKLPDGELLGTHTQEGAIFVSEKVPPHLRDQVADHEHRELEAMTLLKIQNAQKPLVLIVRETTAPENSPKLSERNLKINWNLNIREGRIVYMPPEEYMERVNIFNRIGMSRVIEDERRAIGKGYRGIGYYPPLSEQSYRSVLEGIRAGNEMDIPNIVYRNGMVENQEGFHRALVARDIGIEKIPVRVIGEMPSVFIRLLNLRWNENQTEQVKAINALKGKIIGGVPMIRESTTPSPESVNIGFVIRENITLDIENVLRRLKIEGNTVKITEQLDRKLYEGVNAVLVRLGGNWNKSAQAHIFPSDPTERINAVLTSGKLEPKVKTGYFPTPPGLARRMVEMLDLKPGDKVLEPSAGQGGLLDQLPKGTQVIIGEILPENIQILKQKGYNVNFDNFLGVEIGGVTKVIMNPPFENQQDIEHVTHALRMLQPGGTLVSVMSPGIKFRDNKKTTGFIEMLDRDYYHEIIDLPEGSFKESGTGINAVLLKVTKPMSTPSTVSSEFVADTTKVNPELAARSHMGTSWDPEKRAQQEIEGFAGYVQEVYDNLKPYAKTEAQKAFLDTEIKRFQDSFAKYYNELLSRKGQTMSTFITGGSGFNVRRAEKANAAESSKYNEMIEFRDRAKVAIIRELKKMAVEEAGGELEVLKKKIADAIRNHEFMVKTNAIVRKKIPDEQKIKEIQALAPISEITVRKLFTPDYMGRIGFPAYALSNDTANIHRMEERVKELERKEATPSADIEFEGGSIKDNATEDRVQIFFNKKPEQAMIDKLKGEGWHWSPSSGCWQRKRTDQAMWSAERILGIKITRERFVPVKIDPARALYEAIQREKGETAGVKTANFISIIQKLDNLPLRQQEVNRAKLLLSSLPNLTLDELIALEKTVKQWGVTVPQIKDEIEAIYKEYLELRKSEIGQFVSTAPDKLVTIIEKEYDKPVIPYTAPQPNAILELRWVYGTQDEKWHLVVPEDRDYVHGITQERMKLIGQDAAKAEYLSPAFTQAIAPIVGYIDHLKKGDKVSWESPTMRGTFIEGYFVGYNTDGTVDVEHRLAGFAPYKYTVERSKLKAVPVQQPSPEESTDLNKLILIIKKYVTVGTTYEDFSTGRTFVYLSKSGVKLDPNNIPSKLKDDLKKAGYNSLSELWNDTSRKLRMKMYVPPKLPLMLYPPPAIPAVAQELPLIPEKDNLDNVIALMEQYARDGKTYEDFVAGLKGYYLIQSGYQINNHLNVERLSADRKKAGYNTLTELWNDTSRKLRMRMYVPPKHPPLLYPAIEVTKPAEEIMIVPNPEKMTRDEYIKESFMRLAQVLRQQGKIHIAQRAEMGTDPEYTSKFAASHRDQVVLALAQGKTVTPAVLRDYPDIIGRIRKENEELLAKIRAERERLLAIERIEENELNAELNRLPPALKRHAETEIYGTLHLPDTHKDYRNRYYIALGKVRRIAFEFPGGVAPQVPQAVVSKPLGKEITEPWELTQEEYWRLGAGGKAFEGRGTSDYNHKEAVYKAIIAGKPVPANVLKDYPDLIRREVPVPSTKIQTIQDIKQQVINSIQEAKSMVELKQILKGFGFLPLPEPEKRQLMDLYQIRFSELMGELKFGERIIEEEKRKKRRAPQKVAYAPPSRRLEEFGIKEAVNVIGSSRGQYNPCIKRGYSYA